MLLLQSLHLQHTGVVGAVFADLCAQSPDCAGGIYTAEAFDGIVLVALAAFAQMASPGATLSQVIMATGQGLAGASGDISFMSNGDVPGAGYCVGDFTEDADGNVAFTCNRSWTQQTECLEYLFRLTKT